MFDVLLDEVHGMADITCTHSFDDCSYQDYYCGQEDHKNCLNAQYTVIIFLAMFQLNI